MRLSTAGLLTALALLAAGCGGDDDQNVPTVQRDTAPLATTTPFEGAEQVVKQFQRQAERRLEGVPNVETVRISKSAVVVTTPLQPTPANKQAYLDICRPFERRPDWMRGMSVVGPDTITHAGLGLTSKRCKTLGLDG